LNWGGMLVGSSRNNIIANIYCSKGAFNLHLTFFYWLLSLILTRFLLLDSYFLVVHAFLLKTLKYQTIFLVSITHQKTTRVNMMPPILLWQCHYISLLLLFWSLLGAFSLLSLCFYYKKCINFHWKPKFYFNQMFTKLLLN
jgi:hypothetical protein